jgi:hypothetical protein
LKPFKPGETGNPKGRPKKLPELDKLLADVLGEEKDGTSAAEAILKALRAKATKGDVRAAELILNRAYGKPKENQGAPFHHKLEITWNEPGDINLPNTQDQGSNGVIQGLPGGISDNS